MQTYVYILHSDTLDRYYTGLNTHPVRRLKQHRQGESHWSSRATDWTRIFLEPCADEQSARELEKRIKAQGAKRFLIRRANNSTMAE